MRYLEEEQARRDYTRNMAALEKMVRLSKELKKENSRLRKCDKAGKLFGLLRKGDFSGIRNEFDRRRQGLDLPLHRDDDPSLTWRLRPDRYFSHEKIAVYTACMGSYDNIEEPLIWPDNIDYFLVTDSPPQEKLSAEMSSAGKTSAGKTSAEMSSAGNTPASERIWEIIPAEEVVPPEYVRDPVLANRWCKMHPHELFPRYPLSIYLDSNIRIVSDLTALTSAMTGFPVCMFRHKQRDCVYEEIHACLLKKKDTRTSLQRQQALLRTHGVPEHYGLLEAPVLVRRHADPACRDLMLAWWDSFLAGSRRDQIALIDALWKLEISPSLIGTLGNDVRECDLFMIMPHAAG